MITILFTQTHSIYKSLVEDTYDKERNALNWKGGNTCIAHPPCRAWGNYSHKAKPEPGEKELSIWAIQQVRQWGGILEHPKSSKLFKQLLPQPGKQDLYGGWTLSIDQHWFGHPAKKPTYLYIVGIEPKQIPAYPISLNRWSNTIEKMSRHQREHTPLKLAKYLINIAELIESNKK